MYPVVLNTLTHRLYISTQPGRHRSLYCDVARKYRKKKTRYQTKGLSRGFYYLDTQSLLNQDIAVNFPPMTQKLDCDYNVIVGMVEKLQRLGCRCGHQHS